MILVPSKKPPDTMMDLYSGHPFDLKTRVGICMHMYVVPVNYRTLAHMFHFIICPFPSVTGNTLRCNSVKGYIFDLFIRIYIWT